MQSKPGHNEIIIPVCDFSTDPTVLGQSRDVATKELMKLLDDGKVCKMCTRLNSRCSSENM
jgi:hypothetical protein